MREREKETDRERVRERERENVRENEIIHVLNYKLKCEVTE